MPHEETFQIFPALGVEQYRDRFAPKRLFNFEIPLEVT